MFLRDVPGLEGFSHWVAGWEVDGVLRNGGSVKAAFGPVHAPGKEGGVFIDSPTAIEPSVYGGRNIGITLRIKGVPPERLDSVGSLARAAGPDFVSVQPHSELSVAVGRDIHTKIFQEALKDGPEWTYDLTLYPGIHRDKSDLLVLAGRHVLFFAPAGQKRLAEELELRGHRLFWKESGAEYTDSGYAILNIVRYRRYPSNDTELRKIVQRVEVLYEKGNYEEAARLLDEIAPAINADLVITQEEKNLERSLVDVRRVKIEAAIAKRAGDLPAWRKACRAQIAHLDGILTTFKDILVPSEVSEYTYEKDRLLRVVKGS
jgi:hypothetical protein